MFKVEFSQEQLRDIVINHLTRSKLTIPENVEVYIYLNTEGDPIFVLEELT